MSFNPQQPCDDLPVLPPRAEVEAIHPFTDGNGGTGRILNQPYCKISFIVDAGIAKRKTASEYLQELERIGVLVGEKHGRETIYKHPALLEVLQK
jgi:Fic family protein